jgi:hypothetical protein
MAMATYAPIGLMIEGERERESSPERARPRRRERDDVEARARARVHEVAVEPAHPQRPPDRIDLPHLQNPKQEFRS